MYFCITAEIQKPVTIKHMPNYLGGQACIRENYTERGRSVSGARRSKYLFYATLKPHASLMQVLMIQPSMFSDA